MNGWVVTARAVVGSARNGQVMDVMDTAESWDDTKLSESAYQHMTCCLSSELVIDG